MKTWSKKDVKSLIEMYNNGVKNQNIALFLNRTYPAVATKIRDLSIRRKRSNKPTASNEDVISKVSKRNNNFQKIKPWTQTEVENLVKFWNSRQKPIQEICDELGRSKASVGDFVRKLRTQHNIPMRDRREDNFGNFGNKFGRPVTSWNPALLKSKLPELISGQ